jgi:ABC-type Fe3+-citrate transport system substrate-binding protein
MALQYNLAKVYEISENDIEFALQIVTLFLEEVPAEIKSIKVAIEEKDYTRTYSSCHKIKPTLDLLGMDLAYEENIQIMTWAKAEGKRKEIDHTFDSVESKIEKAVREISKDFSL